MLPFSLGATNFSLVARWSVRLRAVLECLVYHTVGCGKSFCTPQRASSRQPRGGGRALTPALAPTRTVTGTDQKAVGTCRKCGFGKGAETSFHVPPLPPLPNVNRSGLCSPCPHVHSWTDATRVCVPRMCRLVPVHLACVTPCISLLYARNAP